MNTLATLLLVGAATAHFSTVSYDDTRPSDFNGAANTCTDEQYIWLRSALDIARPNAVNAIDNTNT
jgi:hypothetical protein